MRFLIGIFAFLLPSFFLCAEETPLLKPEFISVEERGNPLLQDEVESIDRLIEINEKRLQVQKQLRDQMRVFQKQKKEFILGNQSQKHAFSMVSNARYILGEVKKESLAYLFSPDYLEELVFFSSIAGKSSPVRP